jgi:hypothetical protein
VPRFVLTKKKVQKNLHGQQMGAVPVRLNKIITVNVRSARKNTQKNEIAAVNQF